MRTKFIRNVLIGLVSIECWLAGNAHGQIVLQDGSTGAIIQNNYSNSISTNFTVTSGASVLVVAYYDQNNVSTDKSPATLTWGSQTLTKAIGESNGRSLYADSDLYYLFNPASGTHTITATDTSGSNATAMAMQVYTLSGVNTNVAPVTYATNAAFSTNLSLTLASGTSNGAWGALSFSYGFDGTGTPVLSTSGKTNYAMVLNTVVSNFQGDAVFMGSVSNLSAGASTISIGNASGGGVQVAMAIAVFTPGSSGGGGGGANVTPQFSGLSSPTTTYGSANNVSLLGTVSTNGNYLPMGTTVSATVDGNKQQTTIYDSTGDFILSYNTMSIPASASPYTVIYTSAAASGFNAATNTSTTMTINKLPVGLGGSMVYNGSTTVPAADLTVTNLVGSDNLTLSGSITISSPNVGTESISSFSGLTLGGTSAANYTLTGTSGAVTITSSGGGGGLTNWIGVFTNSSSISDWVAKGGSATCTLSFAAGDAPPWGPSSGALVMTVPVTPSGLWTEFGKNLGGVNLTNYTQLEFDIKVSTNQTVWDQFFNACNTLNPLIEYGSSGSPNTANSSVQPAIAATAGYNGWQHMVFPASDFGATTNLSSVQWTMFEMIEDYFPTSGNMVLEFANIEWDAPPAPVATVSVNASNTVRTADTRWFGVNVGDWDSDFNLTDAPAQLKAAGLTTLRFPGGVESDVYHWANPAQLSLTFTNFAQVATNVGATPIITVNYGSGTPTEAAGWVSFANVTNHYGFKYWEVGNEEYGSYETDNHTNPHDPYTYASNAATYIQQMKAADSSIKVGVTVLSGLQIGYNGYTNHAATNLLTGQIFHGWNPVVLSTLRQRGATPDFIDYHYYPENYPAVSDNDQTLLASANWAADAAELRGEISDFFGSSGTNIELLVTENNSDEGNAGKQSTSLVNGLYYADSLGQMMQTEFNARVWWDLRDGGPEATNGDMSASLYGWRMYGGFGMMWDSNLGLELTNRFPQYFAAELLHHFIGGSDKVVQATSGNPLVSAYGVLRTNGNLTLLVINKSLTLTNYSENIMLDNYTPSSTATVYSYGIPQDNAAKAANNSCDITTNTVSAGANFNYTIEPYSINVFNFTP
ncbi:MAG TPA: YDG domain-containing protein [Verrucomicrobiae bacterium]|jgi:hypothetical protein|nr:YDG domain-containing protein [Verrucomicrobiae bacterium]